MTQKEHFSCEFSPRPWELLIPKVCQRNNHLPGKRLHWHQTEDRMLGTFVPSLSLPYLWLLPQQVYTRPLPCLCNVRKHQPLETNNRCRQLPYKTCTVLFLVRNWLLNLRAWCPWHPLRNHTNRVRSHWLHCWLFVEQNEWLTWEERESSHAAVRLRVMREGWRWGYLLLIIVGVKVVAETFRWRSILHSFVHDTRLATCSNQK